MSDMCDKCQSIADNIKCTDSKSKNLLSDIEHDIAMSSTATLIEIDKKIAMLKRECRELEIMGENKNG